MYGNLWKNKFGDKNFSGSKPQLIIYDTILF
jgi:hypothetical protein